MLVYKCEIKKPSKNDKIISMLFMCIKAQNYFNLVLVYKCEIKKPSKNDKILSMLFKCIKKYVQFLRE